MIVLLMEKVPAGLRGELSRWMIEPKTGVFVGSLSAIVRDGLWERACKSARGGSVVMIYTAQNVQGFKTLTFGSASRLLLDWEGLCLPCIPSENETKGGKLEPKQE